MQMHKIQSMLFGIAIGDAYGAGYEFIKGGRKAVKESFDFTKYRAHPSEGYHHEAGMYTDDTQMSIAVSRLLISDTLFTKESLADYFVSTFKKNPIKGYAKGFQAFLESVDSGKEFLERIEPTSKRNGAAMRAVPLGLDEDLEKVISHASTNAKITHNTPEGEASSIGVALISHYAYHYQTLPSFLTLELELSGLDPNTVNYLEKVDRMEELQPEILFGENSQDVGVPCDGRKTLGAVYFILKHYGDDLSKTLQESVLLGGDTDSVASIALGIASLKTSILGLPSFLYKNLTSENYGRNYLMLLGQKLAEKYDPTF